MGHTFFSNPNIIVAVITVVGVIFASLLNNWVSALVARRTHEREVRVATTDAEMEQRKHLDEREQALQKLAQETWDMIRGELQKQIDELRGRTEKAEGQLESFHGWEAAWRIRGLTHETVLKIVDLYLEERTRQFLSLTTPTPPPLTNDPSNRNQ